MTNGITAEQDIAGNPISPAINTTSLNRGIDSSANVPITPGKSAPPSTFISQPTPSKPLGNLSQDELRAYFAQTGFSESSNNYTAENTLGYQGKYQFGSAALVDLGYVKPGTSQTPEALNNPNNWTGKNGISSAAAFQASPSVQEDAMYNYTKQNYATLQRQGLITGTTDNSTIAGLLSASHLAGPGNVKNWVNSGTDFSDGYGST